MRWLRRIPVMTVMWLTMGALVTGGFYAQARNDQDRCEAGNEFRRQALPMAFDRYTAFLGVELGADQDRIDDARDRVAADFDRLFPERDCPLF